MFPQKYNSSTPPTRQFRIVSRSACLLLLLLTGCASTGKNVEPTPLALPDLNILAESAAMEEKQNLPNQALDAELLEQLLLMNLASYQGDWKLAVENSMATAERSRDPRVARLATLLSLRIKDYQAAVKAAQIWVDVVPDASDASSTLLLAQVGAGMVDEAIASFTEQRGDAPIEVDIKNVAGLLVRQSNSDSALQVVNWYIEEYPESAQVMLSAAYVAESFESDELAGQWMDGALSLQPGWDLAAQMKASRLRRQGKTEELSAYIKEFVMEYPGSVTMRINYAAELAREDALDESLAVMQAVLEDAADNVPALSYAAALAQHLQQTELAKSYYRRAIKIEPSNEEVRWALARQAVEEEKYYEAERHYEQITSDENYLRAQLQVSNMRYHTRSLKDAINTLRMLEPETEADYVEIAINRHWLLMQDHQYEEALGSINETLVYLPDNTELKYARALVAAELKEINTTEQDLREILAKQPNHANALNALGYTLADQTDRFEEAKKLISKALELRPADVHILDSMGWVLYRLKDYDGAIEFLQQAFDSSEEAEVAAHLGEVLWESGQQDLANDIWNQALQLDADNPLLIQTLERYGVQPTS